MEETVAGAGEGSEIEKLFSAIRAVRARPRDGLSAGRVAEELVLLRQADDLLQLACAETVRQYAEAVGPDEDTHPVGFLRCECRDSTSQAVNLTAVAYHLETLEPGVRALEAGRIGFDHLALLAETQERIGSLGRWSPELEARLLAQASEQNVTRFRRSCLHARHAADAEGFLRDQREVTEQASLEITGGHGGPVWLRGVFPADTGAVVRTALEALAGVRDLHDERPRDVRLAHALVEVCEHALDSGSAPRRGGVRPHLQVTATLETLLGRAGAPAGELEFSLPISAKTVQRLACDCTVTRVLLDSDSVVIDVGRGKRIVGSATRRALHATQKSCQWPGCDRPGSWCTPHHLVHWAAGGSSDLVNQVLLCWRHHWLVHEGEWQLVRTAEGGWIPVPPVPAYCRGPDLPAVA